MQTEVVNRVVAWAMTHPLEHPFVMLERPGAHATREHDHVGFGELLEGRVSGDAEHSVLTADLAAPMSDEGDVDEGDALENLVGPDGVERREPGEQRYGDVQGVVHVGVLSSGDVAAETATVGVGRHAEPALGDPSQRFGRAESAPARDHIERVVGRLQLHPGGFQAYAFDNFPGVSPTSSAKTRVKWRTLMAAAAGQSGYTVIAIRGRLDQRLHRPHGRALGAPDPNGRRETASVPPVGAGT